MITGFLTKIIFPLRACPENSAADEAYALQRSELAHAGLSEDALRKMDPDDRVAALERARLDPYDFIYLAC